MAEYPFDVDRLVEICRQNHVAKISVFGSMARGEASERSDIDLLIEFSQRTSLLSLVALERKLSVALDRKVDLPTEASISPYLRENVLKESRVIYAS